MLLVVLSSISASAGELIFTIEYYHTNNDEIIDKLRIMEEANEDHRQNIYTSMENADEGSLRTLNMLLDILKWQQNRQYRDTLTASNRIFSQDFIIEENDSLYQGVMLPGGWLDVSFHVKTKKRHNISSKIRASYNSIELFSGAQTVYPVDKLILLHESYTASDNGNELGIFFLEITRCGIDICIPDVEEEK
jgi:Fic family protein